MPIGVMLTLRQTLFHRMLHLPLPKLWDMKTGGILSRLSGHEHIIGYYEHGKIEGRLYCLMEYIEAENLKELFTRQDPVLARIKFELKGRYVSDNLSFDLGNEPLQWVALSGSDLTEYDRVSLTVPKPALAGIVKPGGSMEGWVGFTVAQKDSRPVMVFDPDAGGATGRGKTVFFKLYP